MKLSKGKNNIVGLLLTEVKIGVVSVQGITIQARFALIDEESNVVAEAPRSRGFSTKVEEALTALVEALEADQMLLLFGKEEETAPEDGSAIVSPKDIETF